MKKLSLFLILSTLFFNYGIGQKAESFSDVSKEYLFEEETSEKEVEMKIAEGVVNLIFSFNSEIENGKLEIQIYDPNGKKEGNFKLESKQGKSTSSNSNTNTNNNNNTSSHNYTFTGSGKASGNMNKNIASPLPGLWKIKIKTEKVIGRLLLNVGQQTNK